MSRSSIRPRLAGALVLAAALAACSAETSPATRAEPLSGAAQRREPTRVRTRPVVVQEMVRALTTTAIVESELEIEIFPRSAGVVVEIAVEEGDAVAAGEVLAVLDDREAAAALREAQVALDEARQRLPVLAIAHAESRELQTRAQRAREQAERDLERYEKDPHLFTETLIDERRLARDQARSDEQSALLALERAAADEENGSIAVARAQVQVERAELALSFTRIAAPFEGVIAQRSIKVGDTVSTATSAFVLTEPDRLRAVFYRQQDELPLYRRAGGPANGHAAIEIRAVADAIPGVVFPASVELVSPTIDPLSGTFRVTLRLEQPPAESELPRLLPGMHLRLSIVTERHPTALTVAKRALRREGDAIHLFVAEEGLARRVAVREGFASDLEVEVLPLVPDSLQEGAQVVVVGNRDLEDGAELLAVPWDAAEGGVEDEVLAEGGR